MKTATNLMNETKYLIQWQTVWSKNYEVVMNQELRNTTWKWRKLDANRKQIKQAHRWTESHREIRPTEKKNTIEPTQKRRSEAYRPGWASKYNPRSRAFLTPSGRAPSIRAMTCRLTHTSNQRMWQNNETSAVIKAPIVVQSCAKVRSAITAS